MDDEHIKTENNLRAEVCTRLVRLGIDADLIRHDVMLSRDFWADMLVIDKFSRQPLMAFEFKMTREGKNVKPPYHVGNFADKIPYYLIVDDLKAGVCWIARMRSEDSLSASVDWNDEVAVCKLLSIDYAGARMFAKGMDGVVNALASVKKHAEAILKFWFPVVLLAALVIHIWFKPLTWELVSYYGILVLVVFVGSGIPIHLKYKELEALIGEWRKNAKNENGKEGGRL